MRKKHQWGWGTETRRSSSQEKLLYQDSHRHERHHLIPGVNFLGKPWGPVDIHMLPSFPMLGGGELGYLYAKSYQSLVESRWGESINSLALLSFWAIREAPVRCRCHRSAGMWQVGCRAVPAGGLLDQETGALGSRWREGSRVKDSQTEGTASVGSSLECSSKVTQIECLEPSG